MSARRVGRAGAWHQYSSFAPMVRSSLRQSRTLALVAFAIVSALAAPALAKPRGKAKPAKARSAATTSTTPSMTPSLPKAQVVAPTKAVPLVAPLSPASGESPAPVSPMPVAPDADRGTSDASARAERNDAPVRIGALLGVGFPRPLAATVLVAPTSRTAFGGELSFSPAITLAPVTIQAWGVAADARVFPFRGAFFVGVRGGFQRLTMTATMNVPTRGAVSVEAVAETAFVNPRAGFMWRTESGLTFGVDAGVELPVHPTLRALWPVETPDGVKRSVTRVADALGNAPTPSVDLLRVGMLF